MFRALQVSEVVEEVRFDLTKIQGNCCVEIGDQDSNFSSDSPSIEHCLKALGVEVAGEAAHVVSL